MKHKKHDFRVLSKVKCAYPGCPKKLKQNLIDKNPDAELCYNHDRELKGLVKKQRTEQKEAERKVLQK